MGSCTSCAGARDIEDIDREVLANFLQNKENLKTIWHQFNKNEDDVLDRAEFDRLLFSALQVFCKERDPNMPPPTRESMEPFIEKLRNELAPRIDTDGDGVISFNEFKTFGEYLKKEYNKLQVQTATKAANAVNVDKVDGNINTNANNLNTTNTTMTTNTTDTINTTNTTNATNATNATNETNVTNNTVSNDTNNTANPNVDSINNNDNRVIPEMNVQNDTTNVSNDTNNVNINNNKTYNYDDNAHLL